MEWNSDAKKALHAHVRKSTKADPTSENYQDLFTDLTAHVEEELHQKGLNEIDQASLQSVLSRMGDDEFDDAISMPLELAPAAPNTPERSDKLQARRASQKPYYPTQEHPRSSLLGSTTAWIFTIIIPIIALLVELRSHEARLMFFDPIPSWVHVLLIALVPITFITFSLFGNKLRSLKEGDSIEPSKLKTVKVMLGFILPIIVYYTVLFIPIVPMALIGCIFLVGLLPLAPLFCLIGWIRAYLGLKNSVIETDDSASKNWMKYGLISGIVCLLALETPSYLAQKALTDAASSDVKTSQQGIENIRRFGGEDELLFLSSRGEQSRSGFGRRIANSPAHWINNLLYTRSISSDQARTLYYQVTGVPFNSVKPDDDSRGINSEFFDDFTWDEDHGGDEVAARTRGLSLYSSRMDMHVDDESKLGYLEWIIEFKNDNRTLKEARMQIALPHNSFVSKLTLWVNDEERPASFNTVSKVKSAYKQIAVTQRRDPVLVNVSGADRIMLQCFPVPSGGGIMKMKVGITFPLSSDICSSGNIHFPYIAERNFGISNQLKHEVYAQGNLQINSPNATRDRAANINTLQYALNNPALKTERITWKDLTPNNSSAIWTIDPFHKGNDKYLTRLRSPNKGVSEPAPRDVIIVVDSSAPMAKWKPMIAKLLEEKNSSLQLYLAGSQSEPLVHCKSVNQLKGTDFLGGVDNVYALRKALILAKQSMDKPASILWLHGAQPVKFPSIAGLEQDLERSLLPVPIYDVSLEDGANHILEAFKGSHHFHGGCRVVNETDLIHMAESISNPQPKYQYEWTRSETAPLDGVRTWDHLARNWAHETTLQHLNDPKFASLPALYQIVTPLSGAVVLESNQQYIETGLEIPNSDISPSIPATPEPSSSLLILIGAMMVAMRRSRRE